MQLATDRLFNVGFTADGQSLLVVNLAKPTTVVRHAAADGDLQEVLGRPDDAEFGAALSNDGRLVAWGCRDNRIRVWDRVARQERICIVAPDEVGGGFLRFSPNGKLLTARLGTYDRINSNFRHAIWDVELGSQILTLSDPSGDSLTFSPDGKLVATGGSYRKPNRAARIPLADLVLDTSATRMAEFKVLDTATGLLVARVRDRSTEWVNAMAFSPDGKTLAVGDFHGTLTLWEVPL